jgi:hypothetical protein
MKNTLGLYDWIPLPGPRPPIGQIVWLEQGGKIWMGSRCRGEDGWLWGACSTGIKYVNGAWVAAEVLTDADYQPARWARLALPPPMIRLDSAVPARRVGGAYHRWPFLTMQVGESFKVRPTLERAVSCAASRAKQRNPGWRWSVRKDKRGVLRCWRVS